MKNLLYRQKIGIREVVACEVSKLLDLPCTLFRIHTGLCVAVSMCHGQWNFACVYCRCLIIVKKLNSLQRFSRTTSANSQLII